MAPKPTTRSSTGNRQTTQPISPNRKIIGRYRLKPVKVPKGLIVKKRGGNKGYVTVRAPAASTPAAASPTTAKATPSANTYPEYSKYPFAQRTLADIDRAQSSHQDYANQVGQFLQRGLTGLTGVDPSAPGYNPQVQQQYLANVAGQVGGALNAAATATPGTFTPTTPGAVGVGNMGFLGDAARTSSAQRSSAALQMAQAQSAMNTLTPNIYAQGAMRAFADMQAGLPALYATKRSEARTKIDEFIMESEEEARHNRVTEATNAWNAQTQAQLAAAQLGLKADDQAFDQTQAVAQASAPAPRGYFRDVDGNLVRDPSVPQATDSGSGGGGAGGKPLTSSEISSMNGKWKRPRSSPPKLGAGWKQPVWDSRTRAWYAKRAGGAASGTKASAGTPAFDVGEDLQKAIDDGLIDTTDQGTGTPQMLNFLRKHQPSKGPAWQTWWTEILPILSTADPDLAAWMVGYKKRRERGDGGVKWKGVF